MNRDLFLAVLAMDSYNRGRNSGISGFLESGDLGLATIREVPGDTRIGWADADFYALAYEWNGETIISYRGTDSSADFWGYGVGAGNPLNEYGTSYGEIVGLAVNFYQNVAGAGSDPFTANIATTGHSLGGGLAGYLAGLYGGRATLFDNMAFEAAATNTSELAADPSLLAGAALRDLVYGSSATTIPQADFSSINAYATTGEFLIVNRPAQSTPVEYLDTNGGNLNPIELHSMALHVALQYARVNAAELSGWEIAASPLWDAFFEDAIADSLPGWAEFEGTKSGIEVIQIAIAYSAIDEGVRPFGDTAIRAMFNDTRDFGAALGSGLIRSTM